MTHGVRRVLLAGASGYIGRAVLQTLRQHGYHVTALVRHGTTLDTHADATIHAELTDAEVTRTALADVQCDAIISCLASRTGTHADAHAVDYLANRQLLAVSQDIGIQHFILLSAICVQKPVLAFQQAKLAFEKKLRESGLDYTIIRPTAFFKSLSGQIQRIQQGKPFLLFGDGELTACKPISANDLATFIVDTLDDPDRRNRTLPIGGPGPAITPRAQGKLLFEIAGKPARFRSVPPALFLILRALLWLPGFLSGRIAQKRELLRIGHYYATESMLVWNAEQQCYDEEATPGFGKDTLEDHYRSVLASKDINDELGEHKLF